MNIYCFCKAVIRKCGVDVKEGKKWQIGYRTATTIYPCFLPDLGEFDRSWSYRFANAKVAIYFYCAISDIKNLQVYFTKPFRYKLNSSGLQGLKPSCARSS